MRWTPWLACLFLSAAITGCGNGSGDENGQTPDGPGGTDTAETKSTLKQLGVAFLNFHDVYGHFPGAVSYATEGDEPLLSWRVAILPQIEQGALYEAIDRDKAWDDPANAKALERMPAYFRSPGVTEPGMTTLMMFTGPGTPNPGIGEVVKEGNSMRQGMRLRDNTDGSSNTVLAVYAAPEKAVPWTKPVDLVVDPDDPLACVGEIPETGLPVVFCDGHVRFLPPDMAADLFRNIVNPRDGNVVELP